MAALDSNSPDGQAAYVQLQAFLAQRENEGTDRLPPERELCEQLGVSRGELRKALAMAEADGQIWRHVGKGTFVGPKPDQHSSHFAAIANLSNPAEVTRTRLLIEPTICSEAALHANAADIAELNVCASRHRQARSWRNYESWDNRFHRLIAEASHNSLLLALFDMLNAVRRAVVWGRLRADASGPSPSHHSYAEHEAIVQAIAERDLEGAAQAMRVHLDSVARHLGGASR